MLARDAGDYERARSWSRKAFCCNATCFITTAILYTILAVCGAVTYIVIYTVVLHADNTY